MQGCAKSLPLIPPMQPRMVTATPAPFQPHSCFTLEPMCTWQHRHKAGLCSIPLRYRATRNLTQEGTAKQVAPVTMQNQDAQKCQLEMPGFLTARNMSGGSLRQQLRGEQLASRRLSESTMPNLVSKAGQMVS